MRTRLSKFIGFLFAAFGVVSAFAQTLVLPTSLLRYSTFGVTILCAVVSLYFFRKARHHAQAITALNALIKVRGRYTVRPVTSEAELREVWRVDVANFEDHAIPIEDGITWWTKYPQGVYVLTSDNDLLGYISFWPLSQRSFDDFKTGRRLEKQISNRCITPPKQDASTSCWYIGSIALLACFRRTKAIRELLRESIAQWLCELSPNGVINICALAYSSEGENLLHRFGFHKFSNASESPHHLSVYILKSSPADLRMKIDEMMPIKRSPVIYGDNR